MFLITDYVEPAELTGYMRAALEDRAINKFMLDQFIPNRLVDDLVYRFTRGAGGLTEAATYRAYDAESPVSKRPGLTRVTGELPPISRKLRLGEYDQLRLRRAPDEAVRNAIFNDARTLARQIAARIEVARGDALTNGSVTINENGIIATVDFGRAAGHSVTAAASWALPGTNILNDITTWSNTYNDSNGEMPGRFLTSRTVLNYMLANDAVRGAMAANGVTPQLVNREQLNAWLARFDFPPVEVYDAKVKVNGTDTRIIPNDVFLMLPAPVADAEDTDLGATLWGTTLEAMDSRYSLEIQPGIVAGSYKTDNPIAIWTNASAIALPVLANPDLTFKADVVP